MKATTEKAFEAYIEETLTKNDWKECSNNIWNKKLALFPDVVIQFIQVTQKDLWLQMEKLHARDLPQKIIEALAKERNTKGTIHVLRHGFKFYGKTFRMGFFKPAHSLNQETLKLFQQNHLTVTRQVPCHPSNDSTVDMVLAMNGLPFATLEVKNPFSGQTWMNAIKQYKNDRDQRAPLFQFKKGAIVHFAVDPNEVYMTTHLQGERTFFLPFNRGSHPGEIQCGKGNPPHPSGHRTGYFWDEILTRESFIDIVGSFVFLETSEETIDDGKGGRKKVTRETMIFPRYHQLDSVRKLVHTSRKQGTGSNYLIQHSAGSGKTNSISWLSHRLSSLHNESDEKIFDCVIVITDRKVLDRQLQDAIYQIEHAQGVVKAIDDNSRQLAEALVDGTKIVVTTLQKFPFVLRGLLHIAGAEDPDNPDATAIERAKEWEEKIAQRKYAVIVDEAHSSQTGETARELKKILGAGTEEGTEESELDWEDGLNKVMESRGRQKNLSFFAFTATPKGKTLEIFGQIGPSSKPEAFHTYSMRQAIQENFILDVLQRYTTYKTYYNILKKAEDDPSMPKKKAIKKLTKFLYLHPYGIEQKTEIIVEHFRKQVTHKLRGRAKALVVTDSRLAMITDFIRCQFYRDRREPLSPVISGHSFYYHKDF
jgi:type I restriction enzyme R subunit